MNFRLIVVGLLVSLIMGACQQSQLTPTPVLCNNLPLHSIAVPTCIAFDNGTLIQTPLHQQAQLIINQIELTIKGTAFIHQQDDIYQVAVLEGVTIAGLQNTIITINQGQQIALTDTSETTNIVPYDIGLVSGLPLGQLQRSIEVILPTPTPRIIPTDTPDCPRPDIWTDQYQVKAGDTLTTIAQVFDVTLEELQTANCINNPDNLLVGLLLYVPQGVIQSTQPAETFTPSAVFFRADRESVSEGDCTTLRWDIQNVRDIFLDEHSVLGINTQVVCPTTSTTYRLTIYYHDETQSQHQVTINMNEP